MESNISQSFSNSSRNLLINDTRFQVESKVVISPFCAYGLYSTVVVLLPSSLTIYFTMM